MNLKKKSAGTKVIELSGVGPVEIKKNNRARRITIRIKNDRTVCVTIPYWCPYIEGEVAVQKKKNWILSTLSNLEKNSEKTVFTFSPDKPYQTRMHIISMVPSPINRIHVRSSGKEIQLHYPGLTIETDKALQDTVKKLVIDTLKKEAKEYLPMRTIELASLHGISINQIRVKNLQSRWGSCSGKNNINLNIHLMRVPEKLSDYVICHELAHVLHKNHSKSYWNSLEKICPGAKKLDKELARYSPLVL